MCLSYIYDHLHLQGSRIGPIRDQAKTPHEWSEAFEGLFCRVRAGECLRQRVSTGRPKEAHRGWSKDQHAIQRRGRQGSGVCQRKAQLGSQHRLWPHGFV